MLDPFAILTYQIHLPIFHHLFISIISWLNNLIWRTIGWNWKEAIFTGKDEKQRSFFFPKLLMLINQGSLNVQLWIWQFLLINKEFSAFFTIVTNNNRIVIPIRNLRENRKMLVCLNKVKKTTYNFNYY